MRGEDHCHSMHEAFPTQNLPPPIYGFVIGPRVNLTDDRQHRNKTIRILKAAESNGYGVVAAVV